MLMSSDQEPKTGFAALLEKIDAHEGIFSFSMEDVRNAYGSERLGVNVRAGITQKLKRLGIGHYPRNLPEYQDQAVRLFRLGSPIEELINAALRISRGNDAILRKAAGGDAEKVLRQVRELVCD
jgi:hypothetical protein